MVQMVDLEGAYVTYKWYLEDALSLEVQTNTPTAVFITEWTYVIPTDKLVLQNAEILYHASGEIEPFDDLDGVHLMIVNKAIDRLSETIDTQPVPSFAINGYST